jgi:hypothetical protein
MIFHRSGRLPALAALVGLAPVVAPWPAQAYGVGDYVQPSDCVAEQAAYGGGSPAKEALEWPYTYKYDRNGALVGPRGFRTSAEQFDRVAADAGRRGDSAGQAQYALRACASRTAAARMEARLRNATAGQAPTVLISGGDCQGERSAYVEAAVNDARYRLDAKERGRDVASLAQGDVEAVAEAVQYNHHLTLSGQKLKRENFLNIAAAADDAAAIGVKFDDKVDAAYSALGACLYRRAAANVGSAGSAAPSPVRPAATEPEPVTCPADRLRSMNQEIADLDSRLERFLATSPNAQPGAGSLPMLSVTMWALQSQAGSIRKYCPDLDAHKQRLDELTRSFAAAQAACDQLKSGGGSCSPTAPEALQ